jgi:hypothetical protein
VCNGFCDNEEYPSPKSHCHCVGIFSDESLKKYDPLQKDSVLKLAIGKDVAADKPRLSPFTLKQPNININTI